MKELQDKIRKKEIEMCKVKSKKKKMVELRILQEQLNSYISKQIEKRNKIFRQKEFLGANKPGKILAWQV